MSKEINKIKNRVSKIEEDNQKLKNQMQQIKTQLSKNNESIKNIIKKDIIKTLEEKNIPNNPDSKYRYTYKEIAEMYNTNETCICRIAKDNNINRGKAKTIS